ncbi:MAG: hypothetical protein PUB86_01485 [Elusimicrobia bacterium]|nr:hypothetical protein [Elusimicrobiota bacterium]
MLKAVQQSEQHRINIRQAGVLILLRQELAAAMALGAIGGLIARLIAIQMKHGTQVKNNVAAMTQLQE